MPNIAFIGSQLSDGKTITGPGIPSVRINGQVISVVGDNVSDGDTMVQGSPTVRAGGKPIVRLGDMDNGGSSVSDNVSTNISSN
jgi:uncharacterized Zn-binding protein involved in type VI secretion